MIHSLQSDKLTTVPGIAHGFFTRQGGVSEGMYASLNCGFGSADEASQVATNRARVAQQLGVPKEDILTLYQHHSPDVVTVTERWLPEAAPKADAMATNTKGLVLGILTADCGPVLLADGTAGVVGAAHAGWKGALAGVLEHVIAAMENLGADRSRIRAVLGPCISKDAYEVDTPFRERFCDADSANAKLFGEGMRPDHWQFDLPKYILSRLKQAGIDRPDSLDQCSYFNEARFFSYRRATHRGDSDYGRNISMISLAEPA